MLGISATLAEKREQQLEQETTSRCSRISATTAEKRAGDGEGEKEQMLGYPVQGSRRTSLRREQESRSKRGREQKCSGSRRPQLRREQELEQERKSRCARISAFPAEK